MYPEGIIARSYFGFEKRDVAEIFENLSSVCILILKSQFLGVSGKIPSPVHISSGGWLTETITSTFQYMNQGACQGSLILNDT